MSTFYLSLLTFKLIPNRYKYFWAARELVDVTDCREITSLQAIVFIVLFLQCSAKLSKCYAFIGVAMRSALRMGLHRSLKSKFIPIEAEVRKRVFFVIRQMDITVGTMLGLPLSLSDDDMDQDLPSELNDECITAAGYLPMSRGSISVMAAANANFRLVDVVSKISKRIYPIKGLSNNTNNTSKSYSISYRVIREIEQAFSPGWRTCPKRSSLAQRRLRMCFGECPQPACSLRVEC